MNVYTAVLSCVALAFVPISPAAADWQYVKWGMSKTAAIEASKGEASLISSSAGVGCAYNSQIPFGIILKKTIGEFTFDVVFCTAGSDKVTSVSLTPIRGTNLPTLKSALFSQYGQPVSTDGDDAIWADKKNGNTITFYTIAGVVGRVEYKQLGGVGL